MVNKKFWAATFTLTGTIIGAGILGLPYVFAQSGFWLGTFWLIFLGLLMIFVLLALGEVTLKSDTIHQLPGYAEKYLGKWGGRLMLISMVFGIYAALIAYLIGEGESLSQLFTGSVNYEVYFGVGFWVAMTLLLREGLKGLKNVGTLGVLAIILLVFGIAIYFVPGVQIENINKINTSNFFLPFGVVLFALLGFASVPELKRILKGNEKLLKKSIILGASIPIIVYFIFSFVFVGVLGKDIPEVSSLAFSGFIGSVLIIFGFFTMMTSYFVLSFAMADTFKYDLKYSKKISFFFVSLLPLIMYLGIVYFGLAGFVKVLSIGGVVSGGSTVILILLMNLKSKKKRKGNIRVPMNWWIVAVLSLIFLAGVVFELM